MTQMTLSVPCHGGAFDWALMKVTKGAWVSSQSMPDRPMRDVALCFAPHLGLCSRDCLGQ
jgi:hypothetical protein